MNQLNAPDRTISVGRILGYILLYSLIVFLSLGVERHETLLLLSTYFGAFIVYIYLSFTIQDRPISWLDHVFVVLLIGTLCFVDPTLSDDIYRFIWDGRLSAAGLDPFLYTPSVLLTMEAEMIRAGLSVDFYSLLNSPDYYSVYPTVMQWVFEGTARLAGDNIYLHTVLIKIILGSSIWGAWYFLIGICRLLSISLNISLLFILNPLLLIEVVGNTHFEGLQIFFISLSIYLILKQKYIPGAITWGLAAAVKLLPLLLIPVIMRYLGLKKGLAFAAISSLIFTATFMPFMSLELIENMGSSIDLYFRSFEFNASVYYLLRELGYLIKGYNLIAYIGPALSGLFLLIYAGLLVRQPEQNKERMISTILWALTLYYLMSTTIHPWYLVTPLFFAVILRQWYLIIWTGVIYLSYATYKINGVEENHLFIWIEYTILLLAVLFRQRIALFVSKRKHQRQKD